ncbi:MAG: twin-arginine translocase subunit TatB [Alphaproteobacteria bacterium]|nr:twin-arginine translocase subunit TatB [Alphaproteobacteria bacterium]
MFDLGWSELLIIGVVAVVVIGPKDLPKVMRAVGHYAGKARGLARDFQNQWDDVVRQAELDEVKKQVDQIASIDPKKEIEKVIDPGGDIAKGIDISGPPLPNLPPGLADGAEAPVSAQTAPPTTAVEPPKTTA